MQSPIVLIVADFDVNTVSREERNEARRNINNKIARVVGWEMEDENSPAWFFRRLREQIEEHEKSEDNANDLNVHDLVSKLVKSRKNNNAIVMDDEQKNGENTNDNVTELEISRHNSHGDSHSIIQPWEFNVIIEGNDGVGKTLFMELTTEFLYAYSILKTTKFVKKSAKKITNVSDVGSSKKLKNAFGNIEGSIMVTQSEQVVESNNVNESGYVANAKTELIDEIIMQAEKPNSFIALACKPGNKTSVKNCHPELETKFPWFVRLPDPTPLHLVKIAELYVQQRNIEFQEGLAQQLSQHLLDTYGNAPEGGVRFVRNLVDQAIRARVERISKQVSISKTNKKLTATDFGIGKELGDPEEIAKVIKEV